MPARSLPPRPSLEQLRKQSKDLVKAYRAGDADAHSRVHSVMPRPAAPTGAPDLTLASAQFVLAREYGFDNWSGLKDRVDAMRPSAIAPLERLAHDIFDAYTVGDADALARLNEIFPRQLDLDGARRVVLERVLAWPDGEQRAAHFTLADAQFLVAQHSGFATWDALVASVSAPEGDPRLAPHGVSMRPPFYRIDWTTRTIHVRPPLTTGDWDTLVAVMKEQALTGLDAGGLMTDAALERVAGLDQLTSLNLEGSPRVSDAGLAHLARLPRLRDLNLNGGDNAITNRGLEVLRELKELRTFDLCWSRHGSDHGIAHLAGCQQLERVNLLGSYTGDGAVKALTGKANLRQFRAGRLLSNAGLPLFHEFPRFKTWVDEPTTYSLMSADAGPTHLMLDGPFTGDGLAHLVGLDGIFGLSIFWHASAFTPSGLRWLASLPRLGFLGCDGKLVTDEAMRHIASIPNLRMLMAQGTVATDDGFSALSQLTSLEYIWGRECPNLTGRGFAALARMPALRGLAVSCKGVDDSALSALPRFPALRELMPMDVPDSGFRHIGACTALEKLWCMYCRDTTDTATDQIAGLKNLTTYYAGKTKITDRSLEQLSRMASLESLEFWEIQGISNVGVGALAGLPRLREVTLASCHGVSRQAVTAFPATVKVTYGD